MQDQIVGMFVGCWARLEMSLDYSNWIILNVVPGGGALASELPRSLGQKIELFRKAHADLSLLADFKIDAAGILRRIQDLKEHRHDLIHGRGTEILDGRSVSYVRLHLKGADFQHLSKTYTTKQLLALGRRANDLQLAAAQHMGRLNRRFLSDQPD